MLADLAQNLMAVIGQRLIPGTAQKRVVAVEVVLGTPHIRGLIQRDELGEMKGATERALEQGMQSFDQSIYTLFESGRISLADALKFADSRTDLSLKIKLEHGSGASDADLKMLRDN
ncbi:Twitching mobility protein [compost metagenome]